MVDMLKLRWKKKLMSELKGTKALDKSINSWLKKNGFDVDASLHTDFCYDEMEEKIYYGLFITENAEEVWKDLLAKWGLKTYYDTFVTCFLHELGHHYTLHLCSNFEYNFSMIMKLILKLIPSYTIQNKIYYSLPIEKIATKWAINYMNEHPKETTELQKRAKKSIGKFLKDNGYEE